MSKPKKLKRIEISRKRWMRGTGLNGSYLRHPKTGKQCCMGFDCRAHGFSIEQIRGLGMPAALIERIPGLTKKVVSCYGNVEYSGNTEVAKELAAVNDDDNITDEVRERKVKSIGKRIGRNYVFVD